jgi:hypothetical protein
MVLAQSAGEALCVRRGNPYSPRSAVIDGRYGVEKDTATHSDGLLGR